MFKSSHGVPLYCLYVVLILVAHKECCVMHILAYVLFSKVYQCRQFFSCLLFQKIDMALASLSVSVNFTSSKFNIRQVNTTEIFALLKEPVDRQMPCHSIVNILCGTISIADKLMRTFNDVRIRILSFGC